MSEQAGNEAAIVAGERAAALQKKLASQAAQPEGAQASSQPEAANKAVQEAANALKRLLGANDYEQIAEMVRLARIPGVTDLLDATDKLLIDEMVKQNAVEAASASPSVRAPSAEVRSVVAEAVGRDSAEPGNVEESPFKEMKLKEFRKLLASAIAEDESYESVFENEGIDVLDNRAYWVQTAWELRGNLQQMQETLVDAISNALDVRLLRKAKGPEYETIKRQNKEIAERIVQRMTAPEEESEEEVVEQPKRGLGSLLKSIAGAPGRGIRRAINGLKDYYSHSVDAVAGRSAEVEQEIEYSPEEMSKLEEFLKLIRSTQKRSRITKQLRKIREKNEVLHLAEDDTENHDAEIRARQDVLNKITEATNLIVDINRFEPNLMDEDPSLQDPSDIVRLLEILSELKVSIDGAKNAPKQVADFMPAREEEESAVEDEEENESEEESGEKKVGFWERVQFWNKGKKEADAFIADADFAYISGQLKDRLRQLDPKDRYFKTKHSALVRTQGLLASVDAAEDYKDRTRGIQRDHKAINQLRKELASLGILASKDAAEKVNQDKEAENKAAEAVDNAELSQGKKNWLKKKLKETGEFLRSPAFLLGVATGMATDLLLHTMGADPQNKAWIKTVVAALVQDTSDTQYLKAQALQIGAAGGLVGMASMGWFRLHDRATQMVGKNVLKFLVGFSGGAVGMHLGHTAFDTMSHNGPTIDHSSPDVDEQPPAVASDLDVESPVLGDGQSEASPHIGQIKPDAGVPVDDLDAPPTAKAPTIEPAAAPVADADPSITAEAASEAAQGIKESTQRWQETLSKWWGGLLAVTREQAAKKQEADAAQAAASGAAAAEPKNPFFTELNEQRAGTDTTANVHDGSSAASNADAPAAGVVLTPSAEHAPEHHTAGAAATAPISSEHAQEAAHATVVAATSVVEQQPPAVEVEVVKFGSEHIWAEAAQITGGDLKRTDFLKDVGVMFDHAGTGNHEHKMGDPVIVIPDSVHTAADLQKLHDLHPEVVGFTLPDKGLERLDAFYQEALNTDPAQRNALQQDVIKHFTGGTPGADLAKSPQAVEAMLKIAHGETVDGSQHIIGSVAEQVGKPVENDGQPIQQTAKEILDAAVQEHNLELKHPLVGQGIIDHLMHELPDNKIDHPELIASFVDGIWDKWVEGCHKLNLDPMQASPKIVDYIKDPTYNGTDPLSVSPVRATIIDYIQHGNSMHGFTMERGDGQTINLNLELAHTVLTTVDDNPSIGQLMANNGVDSAIGQVNIEEVFGNNPEAYYRQVQNKQTP